MKSVFICCFLFVLSYSLFSQPYVLAKDKGNMGSITAFTTIDDNCASGIKNVELIKDSIYFILNEIICRNEKFFVLIFNDKIYFSRDIQFFNISFIRESLKEIRIKFPDFQEQVFVAKKEIVRFKDSVSVVIKRSQSIKDSIATAIYESTLKSQKIKTDSARKNLRLIIDKLGPKKTIIESWSFGLTSEYSNDIYDVIITVFNPFRKKIKYIEFTFNGYNPVNDPAFDIRYSTHIRTVKGVGPIEPLDFSTYRFERFFYSSVLHTLKLKSVKVIFFDGSSAIITEPTPMNLNEKEN